MTELGASFVSTSFWTKDASGKVPAPWKMPQDWPGVCVWATRHVKDFKLCGEFPSVGLDDVPGEVKSRLRSVRAWSEFMPWILQMCSPMNCCSFPAAMFLQTFPPSKFQSHLLGCNLQGWMCFLAAFSYHYHEIFLPLWPLIKGGIQRC